MMKAHHLVYTNVEANASPHKRGGDQTLCWSFDWSKPELDDADRRAIEQRLFYPAKSGEPKFVYFHLKPRWVVVARALPLQERDAFGRAGRIFAHALILTAEQFEQYGANPFSLIHRFAWYENLNDLGQAATTGRLESVELPDRMLAEPASGSAANCDPLAPLRAAAFGECVKPWLMLASQAADLHQHRRAVAVLGSPTETLHWAEALFCVMPAAQRRLAWFDTFYKEDKFNNCYVWLAGFPPTTPTRPFFVRFDRSKLVFQGLNVQRDYLAKSVYEKRWLEEQVQPAWPASLELLVSQADQAAELLHRLEELGQPYTGPVEHPDPVNLDLFNRLFANWDQTILQRRLDSILKRVTQSDRLARVCRSRLVDRLTQPNLETLHLLERGVSQSDCLLWLVEHFGQLPGDKCLLNQEDYLALHKFYDSLAREAKHSDNGARLAFILVVQKRDWPQIVRGLVDAARRPPTAADRFTWMTEWAKQLLNQQLLQAFVDFVGCPTVAKLVWPIVQSWLDEQRATDRVAPYRYLDSTTCPFAWEQLPTASFDQCAEVLYQHYAIHNSDLTDANEREALKRFVECQSDSRTHLTLQLVYWLRTNDWVKLTECLQQRADDTTLLSWFEQWASDSKRGEDRIEARLFQALTDSFNGNQELAGTMLTQASQWLREDFVGRLDTLTAEKGFPNELICTWLQASVEKTPDLDLEQELADQICSWLDEDPKFKRQCAALALSAFRQSKGFEALRESLLDSATDTTARDWLRRLTDGATIRLSELDLQAEPPDRANATVVLSVAQEQSKSARNQRLNALHALSDLSDSRLTVASWWWLVCKLSPREANIDRGGHYKLDADHPDIRCNFVVDPIGGTINLSLRFPVARGEFGNLVKVLNVARQAASTRQFFNGNSSGQFSLVPDDWYDLVKCWLAKADGKKPSKR